MARWHRWGLGLTVTVYLALAGISGALLPLWETPDEPAHVELIRYIQLHGRLPTEKPAQPATTPTSAPGNEYVQVPAYYLVLSPLLAWIWLPPDAAWHRNPYVTWPNHPYRLALALHRTDEGWPYTGLALFVHLGRLAAALFGLVTLVATYTLIKLVTGQPSAALFATAWLGWSPGFVLASSRVSNDAFATMASAIVLLLCSRLLLADRPVRARELLLLSLALTVALLGKLNTAFLVLLVVLTLAIASARPRQAFLPSIKQLTARLAIVFPVPLSALGAWWLLVGRKFGQTVGTQGGFGVVNVGEVLRFVSWRSVASAISTLNLTWWGLAQFESEIVWPAFVYLVLGTATAGLIGGGLVAAFGRGSASRFPGGRRVGLAVLLLAIAPLFYATIAREIVPTISYSAQARFVLPAMPVIALLIAASWCLLDQSRFARALAVAYLGGVLVVGSAAPFVLFPQINPPLIPARLARNSEELTRAALATFANGAELLAVEGLPSTPCPGQTLPLTLRWRVAEAPRQDFTVSVQLVTLAGDKLAGTDVTPFADTFPPRLWERGEIVDEALPFAVPPRLAPGVYTFRIGLYQWRDRAIEPIAVTSGAGSPEAISVGWWRVLPDPGELRDVRTIDVHFGASLRLVGYAVAKEQDTLRVDLLWRLTNPTSERLVVSVQVLDPSGHLVAQHDGEPVDGQLPTSTWPVGESVHDEHRLKLPASGGASETIVVVYDRQTTQRLPVQVGSHLAGDYVVLPPT